MIFRIKKPLLHFKSFDAEFAEVYLGDFHMRCLMHVVKNAIKDALNLIQTNIAFFQNIV